MSTKFRVVLLWTNAVTLPETTCCRPVSAYLGQLSKYFDTSANLFLKNDLLKPQTSTSAP